MQPALSDWQEWAMAFERVSDESMFGERMSDDERRDDDDDGGAGTGVVTRTKPKTKKPSLYKVLLLNDDYTPMEFVVHILERFFRDLKRGSRKKTGTISLNKTLKTIF